MTFPNPLESILSKVPNDGRMQSLFEAVTSAQPVNSPVKPADLAAIESMAPGENRVRAMGEYQKTDVCKKYCDDKWAAQLHNRDAVLWLCDYRDHNSPTEEQREAIDVKIRLFLRVIRPQSNVYPALRLDLQKLGVMHL